MSSPARQPQPAAGKATTTTTTTTTTTVSRTASSHRRTPSEARHTPDLSARQSRGTPPSGRSRHTQADTDGSSSPTDTAADLEGVSEADLIAMIQEAELRTRVLTGEAEHRDATASKLRDSVRETVLKTEVEEDRMSNMIFRRMDQLKSQHTSLVEHLSTEELQVLELEAKLRRVEDDNGRLEETLLTEEAEIAARLRRQVDQVERQKQDLEDRLSMELGDVADHVSRFKRGLAGSASGDGDRAAADGGSPPLDSRSPNRPESARGAAHVDPSSPSHHGLDTPTLGRSSGPNTPATSVTSRRSPTPAAAAAGLVATPSATSAAGGAAGAAAASASFSTPLGGSANSSMALGGSWGTGAPLMMAPPLSAAATSHHQQHHRGNLANDFPMVRLLEQEIGRVRVLGDDIRGRHESYEDRVKNLESRVDKAKVEWERQRAAADKIQKELARTKSLTKELVANHELLVELQAERDINSRSNSVVNTPHQHGGMLPSPQSVSTGAAPPLAAGADDRRPPVLGQPAMLHPSAAGAGSGGPMMGRSPSAVSDVGASSSVGGESTPLSVRQPHVLHGGTPMASARRQFTSSLDGKPPVDAAADGSASSPVAPQATP